MKKLIIATVLALSLVACQSTTDAKSLWPQLSDDIFVITQIHLNDGRVIDCIGFNAGYGKTLDCDWHPDN